MEGRTGKGWWEKREDELAGQVELDPGDRRTTRGLLARELKPITTAQRPGLGSTGEQGARGKTTIKSRYMKSPA